MTQDASSPSAEVSPSALAPMRFPVFRSIWIASSISNLGGLIQSVGAAWMMTSIATEAGMVALVQASMTLPVMLLSLLAGAMADSLDRRRMMLYAQIFLFVVSVCLSLCTWLGLITPWLLLLFTFLIGCSAAFNAPAWQASVGDMVPRAYLPAAVTLNGMGFNIARSFGPALGGAIVAAFGAAAAFAVNAVSYIYLIVVLRRWKSPTTPQLLPRESLGIAISAGIRYVSMSPAIRRVLVRGLVFGLGASSVMALMPLVAKHLVAGGPLTYGMLLGAFGIGAVLAAIANARLRLLMSTENIVRTACIAFGIAAAVTGLSSNLALTMLALMVNGASWVLALATFNVAVQLSAPRWVVARALSLYQMFTFGGLAGGSWLWGEVAESSGVATALFLPAAIMGVCALIGWWWPVAQAEALNLDPLRPLAEPHTEVPVEARTGPVVVTIEYIIREENILEFLAAMSDRRRIRRRDGARAWMLLRDLGNPQIWTERYATPTWADYVRHTSRMTQEDAFIPQRLLALHQGSQPPAVRRMIERQTNALPVASDSAAHDLAEPLTDPARSS
jgi:MFS family permease